MLFLMLKVTEMHAQRPAEQVEPVPAAPDYSDPDAWSIAETPDQNRTWRFNRKWIDKGERLDRADVFYIHPTMYFEGSPWNAAYDDLTWRSRWTIGLFATSCPPSLPLAACLRHATDKLISEYSAADIAYRRHFCTT